MKPKLFWIQIWWALILLRRATIRTALFSALFSGFLFFWPSFYSLKQCNVCTYILMSVKIQKRLRVYISKVTLVMLLSCFVKGWDTALRPSSFDLKSVNKCSLESSLWVRFDLTSFWENYPNNSIKFENASKLLLISPRLMLKMYFPVKKSV